MACDKECFVAGRIYQRLVDASKHSEISVVVKHGVDDNINISDVVGILMSVMPDAKISRKRLKHGYELTIQVSIKRG